MGASFASVIDYLVTGYTNGAAITVAPGSTVNVPPLSAIDPTVSVSDNEPSESAETQVVIGRTSPESGVAGNVDWSYEELGAGRVSEQYTIPGYIAVWRPGPGQKDARTAMVALVDGVVRLVHTDPTFGGILQSGYALVSRVQFNQTQDVDDTAGGGYMYACADFEIAVTNKYIP